MIGSFNDPSIVFLINTYYIGSYHAQRTSFLLTFNTKWVNSLAVVDGILGLLGWFRGSKRLHN